MKKELLLSIDIEADGPIPGPYSLSSLGAYLAGYRNADGSIVRFETTNDDNKFYAELKPISDNFIPEAAAVSGLDREHLIKNGETPEDAMERFVNWVNGLKETHGTNQIVFSAYPLGFDWMWTYWYIINFSGLQSPFGHSKHLDMKTEYSSRAKKLIADSVKARMPRKLFSKLPHTHNALDDAVEQGEFMMNLLSWDGQR